MMTKFIILFLALQINVSGQNKYNLNCDSSILYCSEKILIDFAEQGINERENKDIIFEFIKKSGGNNINDAWCYALQYYSFFKCSNINIIPRSLVANSVFNYALKNGKKAKYEAARHDLIVWKKYNSWKGHIERIIRVINKNLVITIGGNTSKYKGSNSNGDGIFYKQRNIRSALSRYLLIRGLIGFK